MSGRAGLGTSVVEDVAAFDALERDWAALLARSASDSVTLTWEWLRTWWSVYGVDRRLRIVLVRDGERLVGAAPLLSRVEAERHYRTLPFRRMELLASGEAHGHQVCSDYIDWIAETGREPEVAAAVLDRLCGSLSDEWDELILPDVSATSPNLALLESEAVRRGLAFEVVRREPCSVISLPESWEAFLAGVGQGLRYKIKRGRRELELQKGRYEPVEDAADLPEALGILVDLHQRRWTSRGRPGAFASESRRTFHERFMPIALARGWLRLGVLRIGPTAIGAIYNFRYGRKVSFYQSGIALQASTHLRPGLLMHSFEIEAAIAGACKEYDFLKRGRSEYKDEWTGDTRDLLCLRLARRSVKERAYRWLRRAHGGMRSAKQWVAERAARGGTR